MRKKLVFTPVLAVIMAAGAPVAAQAATCTNSSATCAYNQSYDLGDLTTNPENGSVNALIPKLGGAKTTTTFTNTYDFSLSAGGDNGSVYYANLVNMQGSKLTSNITSAALKLIDTVSKTVVLDTSFSLGVSNSATIALTNLAAGTYSAIVTGVANGAGVNITGIDGVKQSIAGNYAFSITAPTPEPLAWMSMMLGLGMVGFAVRRKKAAATLAI